MAAFLKRAVVFSALVTAVAGLVLVGQWMIGRAGREASTRPSAASVVVSVREAVKLESLTVAVYKKIVFSPDPQVAEDTWASVWQWLRHTVNKPHGKAIVFANVHLGFDLRSLDESHVTVRGGEVWVQLPPVTVHVELKPGETEVIGSSLSTAETAQLLEHARQAFAADAAADSRLRERATTSARRAIELLMLRVGFRRVHFGPPPARAAAS